MATPFAQAFLFGQVMDSDPTDELAWLGYMDMTIQSAIVLTIMILAVLIVGYWEFLYPWIVTAVKLTIFPMLKLAHGIAWVVIQLLQSRTREDFNRLTKTIQEEAIIPLANTRLLRLMSAVYTWYFPANRPLTVILRLMGTYISWTILYFSLLQPTYWYLYGLATTLMTDGAIQSV
ncbi:hypothetical protein FE257_008417 [Aspergillus nanangensis]|uniref:Uncharacterized protein n=1 Tax=Aspergillus nanangensis TaxID=2582783 RepID=A0AAD4GSM8_ASPNN|nr:hypothetical protein FE257_008417 [Aspergillus nanangensis]